MDGTFWLKEGVADDGLLFIMGLAIAGGLNDVG